VKYPAEIPIGDGDLDLAHPGDLHFGDPDHLGDVTHILRDFHVPPADENDLAGLTADLAGHFPGDVAGKKDRLRPDLLGEPAGKIHDQLIDLTHGFRFQASLLRARSTGIPSFPDRERGGPAAVFAFISLTRVENPLQFQS
jgi:hypothetical protein